MHHKDFKEENNQAKEIKDVRKEHAKSETTSALEKYLYGSIQEDGENDLNESYELHNDNWPENNDSFGNNLTHADIQASLLLPSLQWSTASMFVSNRRTISNYTQFSTKTTSPKEVGNSIIISIVEKLSDDHGASVLLTMGNMLQCLQGSAIFTMPFAIMTGGLYVIPAFVFMCVLAYITGGLVVECLYEISPRSRVRKRTRMDLVEIARDVWGKKGAGLLNAIILFYMFANNMCNTVLLSKCLYSLIGPYVTLSYTTLALIISLAIVPTTFISKLSMLAYISLLGIICMLTGIITSLVFILHGIPEWKTNITKIPKFNLEGYPVAIGMLLFSLILNAILAQIEGSMSKPKSFKVALGISYAFSTTLKILFGLFGAMTFTLTTDQLVSLNVSELNHIAGIIINISLAIYALSNFPLMNLIVLEAIDSVCLRSQRWRRGGRYIIWKLITRPIIVYLHVAVGIFVPFYGYITGLVGAIVGLLLVYLLPIYFHLHLKWRELSVIQKILEVIGLLIGTTASGLAVAASGSALVTAVSPN